MKAVLVLFQRALRVHDNPALALAATRGLPVVPVFVADPEAWAQPDASARQWRFVAESLGELRAELGALGAPLVVRCGGMLSVLEALCAEHSVAEIISIDAPTTQWEAARNARVEAWAEAAGVAWTVVPEAQAIAAPAGLLGTGAATGAIPEARDLSLAFDPCPGRQRGGRSSATVLLRAFGGEASSRLSPHLAWGVVSAPEVAASIVARRAVVPADDALARSQFRKLQANLALRDQDHATLRSKPMMESRCLHSAYEDLWQPPPPKDRFRAWEAGQTGIPFVDAAMRGLIATGWLPHPLRIMLVSVASYHLWLDWRVTGPHLARLFTDYDPGIHWPQMQAHAGTTGVGSVRVDNPMKRGQLLDPSGAFTRKWCPELRDVPDAYVQTPWLWEGAGKLLGRRYPVRIVDVEEAASAARARATALRRGEGFEREAAENAGQAVFSLGEGEVPSSKVPAAPRPATAETPDQLSFNL